VADIIRKIRDLLWIRMPGGGKSPAGQPGLSTFLVGTDEGLSKIHLRSFADGTCFMVVDGHFLVSLNASSHRILKMKLEGHGNASILSSLEKDFHAASRRDMEEDVVRLSELLESLRRLGPRAMAGEHAGNLFLSSMSSRYPFRADMQLRNPGTGAAIRKEDGLEFLDRLHGWGVIAVRFISNERLQETPLESLVEKTQDLGIISGLLLKGREADRALVRNLMEAGIDYFEIPLFSDAAREHEQVEGRGSFEADLEGIRTVLSSPEEAVVIVSLPVLSINIDRIESTLDLLARCGIRHVNVSAVVVPDALRSADGLGITLQEYEHASVIVEEAAPAAGINYVLASPVWYRKDNPRDLSSWGWKCTASENAPFVTVDGDVFACLHGKARMGSLREAPADSPLPLPVTMLSDLPSDEVDLSTLCNGCPES
jgi:hypothetical protein